MAIRHVNGSYKIFSTRVCSALFCSSFLLTAICVREVQQQLHSHARLLLVSNSLARRTSLV